MVLQDHRTFLRLEDLVENWHKPNHLYRLPLLMARSAEQQAILHKWVFRLWKMHCMLSLRIVLYPDRTARSVPKWSISSNRLDEVSDWHCSLCFRWDRVSKILCLVMKQNRGFDDLMLLACFAEHPRLRDWLLSLAGCWNFHYPGFAFPSHPVIPGSDRLSAPLSICPTPSVSPPHHASASLQFDGTSYHRRSLCPSSQVNNQTRSLAVLNLDLVQAGKGTELIESRPVIVRWWRVSSYSNILSPLRTSSNLRQMFERMSKKEMFSLSSWWHTLERCLAWSGEYQMSSWWSGVENSSSASWLGVVEVNRLEVCVSFLSRVRLGSLPFHWVSS